MKKQRKYLFQLTLRRNKKKIWMFKGLMKTYFSILISGEGWSICLIQCNSFSASCSLLEIYRIEGLIVVFS